MGDEKTEFPLKFHFHQGVAMVPILLYVVLSGVIMVGFHYYSMKALVLTAVIALLIGFLLCSTKGIYWDAVVRGLAKFGNARLILIFMVIGIFSKVLVTGGIGSGFIWVGMRLHLTGGGFVVFCFLASGLIAMGVGAPIAALLAVIPLFYPAGVVLGANPAILTGAMLSGVFFGDAMSPSSQVINTTVASQHEPVTHETARLLETLKARLPYLLAAGILSCILFFIFGGVNGKLGDVKELEGLCHPEGLWMLIPIAVLLFICFKTSNLFMGVTGGIITGIVVGMIVGQFHMPDLISIHYDTQELHGVLFDGLSSVIDIIISTILLYGLIGITVEGGRMDACCRFLTSRKAIQHTQGAEAMISIGVGIVNVLLAGCVLPSIIMFKDVADRIGIEGNVPAGRRCILLTAMATNITAIVPINSAFVMGAVTIINELSSANKDLPTVSPFAIFLSSFYCLLVTVLCFLWVKFGLGRKKGEKK